MSSKRALEIGITSQVGYPLACELRERGFNVHELSREAARMESVEMHVRSGREPDSVPPLKHVFGFEPRRFLSPGRTSPENIPEVSLQQP